MKASQNQTNNNKGFSGNKKQNKGLSELNIAFLYVGTLMGAGFASGKEIWQFFTVFESSSIFAVLMVTCLFVTFGFMTVYISSKKSTTDIGKIVMPVDSDLFESIFGYITAGILFTVYIIMAAAGGALIYEQFGIPKVIGGFLLMMLVIITILDGFERISKNFRYIIPVLIAIVFTICIYIIFADLPVAGTEKNIKISPMAPNWFTAAILYISYNMLAGVPILASSTRHAKSFKKAALGAIIGGLILGLAAFVMNMAMLSDMGLASRSVLPILALSGKISIILNWIYALLLLFAIYSSATSNFYGFTTKLRNNDKKTYYIISAALIGFLLSLFGFSEIIAIILPLEGYFGMLFLLLMTINFIKIIKGKRK